MEYADTRWPWHITITHTNGTTTTTDVDEEFDPLGYAAHRSTQPDVARVDVSVSFVAGEAVAPSAAKLASRLASVQRET